MNRNTKRLSIYITIMLIGCCTAVGLRTSACLMNLDYEFGYFTDKALIYFASSTVLVTALISFFYTLSHSKVELKTTFTSPITYVPTGIVAVALAFISINLFREVFFGDVKFQLSMLKDMKTATALLSAILALVSIVHFFLNAFLTDGHECKRASFAIFTVAFLAVYASYLYFSTKLPINSPNKIVDQMAYILSSLFFLYEARISLGREKWEFYCSFGLISALLLAYSSIPALTVYFVKGEIISDSIEENILSLTLFIFVLSRLVMTALLPESGKNELVTAIEEYAETNNIKVSEKEILFKEKFESKKEEELSQQLKLQSDFEEIKVENQKEESVPSENKNIEIQESSTLFAPVTEKDITRDGSENFEVGEIAASEIAVSNIENIDKAVRTESIENINNKIENKEKISISDNAKSDIQDEELKTETEGSSENIKMNDEKDLEIQATEKADNQKSDDFENGMQISIDIETQSDESKENLKSLKSSEDNIEKTNTEEKQDNSAEMTEELKNDEKSLPDDSEQIEETQCEKSEQLSIFDKNTDTNEFIAKRLKEISLENSSDKE